MQNTENDKTYTKKITRKAWRHCPCLFIKQLASYSLAIALTPTPRDGMATFSAVGSRSRR